MAEEGVFDTRTGELWEDEIAAAAESGGDYVADLVYSLDMPPQSIGRVKAFYGHFGTMVRAYTYIRILGAEGLRDVSLMAVLNANYLQALLKDVYPLPYARTLCTSSY